MVSCTIEALELLCVSTGPRMNTLDELENSLAHCEIDVRPELKQQFKTRVYVPLIKALILHIKDRLPDTGIFAAFSIWIQESFHPHRKKWCPIPKVW